MNGIDYSKSQLSGLVVLRLFIGWHFLYEGVLKLYNPSWSAKGFLMSSTGFLGGFYQWLAGDSLIGVIDAINIVILVGVGVMLILGFGTRLASLAGFVLLLLYYFAHPALPWLPQGPSEGSYFIINKNLIEAAALVVLYQFPTSQYFGLASFMRKDKTLKESVN
jgi:thiosulfate dehydrogenase [quinone] large subunit